MKITAFDLARRFLGLTEIPGAMSEPLILAMLRLDAKWPAGDDVAWCGALVNFVCWLLDVPRTHDLRARSWLRVGTHIELQDAQPGWDVVVVGRGPTPYAPASVVDAPGHVGFFAGRSGDDILILGGNQHDHVSVAPFHASSVVGVRRIYRDA